MATTPATPDRATGDVAGNGYVYFAPRAVNAGDRIAVWSPFHSHGAVLDPSTGAWTLLAAVDLPKGDTGPRGNLNADVRLHWTGDRLIVVAERPGFPIPSTLVARSSICLGAPLGRCPTS